MKLFWNIDWDAETVSFAVEAETTGWVGFGFSTGSGQMIGSDVVIGWVKDTNGYLTDRFADAKAIPPMDEQQDYELTGFQESGGKTLLKFERKFNTCDPRDRLLKVGTTKVVFAYHSEDPVSPTEMKHHEFRGAQAIALLNNMDNRNVDEIGWRKFDLTAKNVTIPARKTTYWCSLLKGPELKTKHHITKVAPNIQKGNEGFVHHFLLYECGGNFNESTFNHGVDCTSLADMPYHNCRYHTPVAVWGVAGDVFYFPPHVGYPIGASTSPKNFMLEMHYDNSQHIKGQTDSSGFTIYYTHKLRKYDAGMAVVGIGLNNWMIVPPKQKDWITVGYCMHQCTESSFKSTRLPGGGINIFASSLHAHLAGRASWTKHVRNGKELPEIDRDDHQDFHFQYIRVFPKEIKIKPGDDIIHYCKYNSMDRDRLITEGGSTRDEMCLNFLFYYPRITGQAFSFCDTTLFEPSLRLLHKYFNNVTITLSNPLVKMDIKWTEEMANDLRRYQSEVKSVIPGCWLYSGNIKSVADLKDPKYRVPVPQITEPLSPPETCTITSTSGED